MEINNPQRSNHKVDKVLRDLGLAATIFGVMNTTQSCKDKNIGIPKTADPIEISQKEEKDNSSEYIKIDNNKVKFSYTFDMDNEWNQKYLSYNLSVCIGKDNKITAILNGSTLYGTDPTISTNTSKFHQEFAYNSLDEFNNRFGGEISTYINSVMDNLQSHNRDYATPDKYISIEDDIVQTNEEAQNEVIKKTSQLTGYLTYKMNPPELSVWKQNDEVTMPIRWNDQKYDIKIQEHHTKIKLQSKNTETEKIYTIVLNGKNKKTMVTVPLSEDPLTFAAQLTKEVEKLLNVGDIPQYIEDESFLGKCLEVQQLINQ